MSSSRATFLVSLTLLLGGGAGLHGLLVPWREEAMPGKELTRPGASAGSFSPRGSARTLAANLSWLSVQASWEDGNVNATARNLRRTVMLDPSRLGFWINGARMLAYDTSAWRMVDEEGEEPPEVVRNRVDREQAALALDWLDRAGLFHPDNVEITLERANIQLHRQRDRAAACETYRRAALHPGAPYYAARLHAGLLAELGRKREAYDWLVKLHPTLPTGIDAAASRVVLARIRLLENELGIHALRSYRPRS